MQAAKSELYLWHAPEELGQAGQLQAQPYLFSDLFDAKTSYL